VTIGNSSRANWINQHAIAADQLQSTVCVWLGTHLIAEWTGPSSKAEDYAGLLSRQFPRLRLTIESALDQAVIH
jgi:hypothetical protein